MVPDSAKTPSRRGCSRISRSARWRVLAPGSSSRSRHSPGGAGVLRPRPRRNPHATFGFRRRHEGPISQGGMKGLVRVGAFVAAGMAVGTLGAALMPARYRAVTAVHIEAVRDSDVTFAYRLNARLDE